MNNSQRIGPGRTVSMHLEVRFQDGFLALSTFDAEPVGCSIGDGTLTAGLERAIAGLAPGDEETILGSGSELFADYDPANVHWLELADFPLDLDPAPGQVVAFETAGGQETGGVVLERDGDRVRVDFNHPFAGRPLALRVRVLEVS
jgi:FKBP-type peptidyl-prolyl cis-trans isomerase SlpA